MKDFLNTALKEIMDSIHADCGSLFLFDAEHKELVLDSFYNSQAMQITGQKKRMGEGVSGKVATCGCPVLVKDIDKDLRFNRNGFSHYRTNSFISIPLVSSGKLIGLMNLADKSSGQPFSEDDLRSAVIIAKYACVAMDSLNNYAGLKAEKESLDKQKRLLEKYASVGKLAAGIVHEINNPLDGIIRYTNMLLSSMDANSTAREYLLDVKKGLSRIADITKSLLDFSYQVNSVSVGGKKYADTIQLIDECIDARMSRHAGKVEVIKNYKQPLPRVVDFGLSHAFMNLIKNACDAMHEGGTLNVSVESDSSFMTIKFSDTGTGIPDDVKERLFEPFFTTKGIGHGTGLGLAICKEIITKYEGCIEVHSTPGKGTTFTLIIPSKYLEHAKL